MRRISRLVLGLTTLGLLGAVPAQAAPKVPKPLADRLDADPWASVPVIVQGQRGNSSRSVADAVARSSSRAHRMQRFSSVPAVAVELRAQDVQKLVRQPGILSITEDAPMVSAGYTNPQAWPLASGVASLWTRSDDVGASLPAIAVVDSGVDATRADFGGRVVAQATLTSLADNSPGDGSGHGTFVAGLAAGSAHRYAGAAPAAPIVSIDVTDDNGMAMTRDVIAAADWILANKDAHRIRVANFSLHSSQPSSFLTDPLARAVERLWHSGVVVVAAAGNYASPDKPHGVPFAPANDPFVITVGAADTGRSVTTADDVEAPWSAYGPTLDGFAKPELGAPGRYLVSAVPSGSRLALDRRESVVADGYMRLSGTSFAAPIVAGAAAHLLALHPEWTPDQVKGALMVSASRTAGAVGSLGVGALDARAAVRVQSPPNPNLALSRFVVDGTFDADRWSAAAGRDPLWNAASWSSASWSSASWTSASWTSASWSSASWTSASWSSASWSSASWTSSVAEVDPEDEPVRQ